MGHSVGTVNRIHRSELAVPATSERFFLKAAQSKADVIFLDLEDAVAPEFKSAAREKAIQALNGINWGSKTMAVRVNGLDTCWAFDDIVDIVKHAPRVDLILLPKANHADDLRFLDQLLTQIERSQSLTKKIGIEALIETALGVANVEQIAAGSSRLEALIFGVGDYTVDMRTYDPVFGQPSERYAVLTGNHHSSVRQQHWNDQWHFAMARIANACRANGLRPIDGPFTDFADVQGYLSCASRAAALGYEGKWAIHPTQIDLANQVFSPTQAQLDWAHNIQQCMQHARESGNGAVADNGVLVDMAHLKQAQALLYRKQIIDDTGKV